jgi:hypothetical protein
MLRELVLAVAWHRGRKLNEINGIVGGGGRESNPPATSLAAKPVLKTGGATGPLPPPNTDFIELSVKARLQSEGRCYGFVTVLFASFALVVSAC